MREIPGYNPENEKKVEPEEQEIGNDTNIDAQNLVQLFARQYLENIYQNPEGTHLDSRALGQRLAQFVGGEALRAYEGGSLLPNYRKAVDSFLEDVIGFVKDKAANDSEKERLNKFLSAVQDSLFSYSPNLSNEVSSMEQMLKLTARANRIPEMQGWMGQEMVGEFVYELSFCDEKRVQEIITSLKKMPLEDRLDVINQLVTVGADAVAQGSWAERAVDRTRTIIAGLDEDPSQFPIVKYSLKISKEMLNHEEQEPSLSVVTWHGNKAAGRLPQELDQKFQEEHERFSGSLAPDREVNNMRMIQIARDAVALLDHSNLPRFVGKVDLKNLPEKQDRSFFAVQNLRRSLDSELRRFDIEELIGFVNRRILSKGDDPQDLVKEWAKIVPSVTKKEWSEYFASASQFQALSTAYNEERYQIQQETEQENEQLSREFLEKFEALAEQVYGQRKNDRFQKLFEQYKEQKERNNLERMFTSAESFVRGLEVGKDMLSQGSTDEITELIASYEELLENHQRNWQRARELTEAAGNLEDHPQKIEVMQQFVHAKNKLEQKLGNIQEDLKAYTEKLEAKMRQTLQPVHLEAYDNIVRDRQLNPFSGTEDKDLPLLLQHLHEPKMRGMIENDLGVSLSEIPLRSQIHLLRFLAGQDQEGFNRLRSVLHSAEGFKPELLQSFLVVAEDPGYGQELLTLAERLKDKPKIAKRVFEACNNYVDKAYQNADNILKVLREEHPNLQLSNEMVVQALVSRGKDFLVELNGEADKGKLLPKLVNEFVSELTHRPFQEQVIRTQFKSMAELLHRKQVDLSKFESQQALVLESLLNNPDRRQITMRTLARMGKLEPIPEIHWRVDRTVEEYDRRLGMDLGGFLKERATDKPKQKLLEIGPGSGVSRQERMKKDLGQSYLDMALADKIYYPLAPLIEKLFDYKKLEQAIGSDLSESDKKLLADFVYKAMVITTGETEQDRFTYDQQVQKDVKSDINQLKEILAKTPNLLDSVNIVPEQRSVRDATGEYTYPYKIKASEQSADFKKAKALLDKDLTSYLRPDWKDLDYHGLIEAFPPNVMVGDLEDIQRLSPYQIDVELAVRSTVYAAGEKYQDFLKNLTTVLADGGVAIDDSIRENDGWAYRLGEVLKAKKDIKDQLEVLVVLGPGFPGQDKRQDHVPLSMLITKNGSSKELAKKYLGPDCELNELEDLTQDQEYLRTLDATGQTLEKVRQALAH